MQDNQKKFAASLLAKAKETCENYGVEAETISVMGNPKDAICDALDKFHCSLLVIGSHSRGALGRLVCHNIKLNAYRLFSAQD
ncbi:Universal stress protein YxiE [Bienertia sinuspersici]